MTTRATQELLPRVPWRQWVLVLPKRLRFFVDRNPKLAGEVCRILTRELTRYHSEVTDSPTGAAPAGISVVQRFGSAVNLHVHVHVVISDGAFESADGGRLILRPAPEPDPEAIQALTQRVRRKILMRPPPNGFRRRHFLALTLGRMARIQAVPQEAVDEMPARPHGGFSLDGKVRIGAEDRGRILTELRNRHFLA